MTQLGTDPFCTVFKIKGSDKASEPFFFRKNDTKGV